MRFHDTSIIKIGLPPIYLFSHLLYMLILNWPLRIEPWVEPQSGNKIHWTHSSNTTCPAIVDRKATALYDDIASPVSSS